MISKNYVTVKTDKDYSDMVDHIINSTFIAYDVESTGLNVRKDSVIGYSVCGKAGTSYYLPLLVWSKDSQTLKETKFEGMLSDYVLNLLKSKELLMWNASFDIRITRNNLEVDLLDALLADVMLMKHTVEEDGEFSLKGVAIQYQREIGLDVEKAANEEQLVLKENIKANGGKISKNKFELFKADLDVIGTYANADTDLTLRLAILFREKLEKEGLESFFYDEEVMPLYKEVTIKMEDKGIKLDIDLMRKIDKEIVDDMLILENNVKDALLSMPQVQRWLKDEANKEYPVSRKGSFAQMVCEYYDLPFPKLESGKYSITDKALKKVLENELSSKVCPHIKFFKDMDYELPSKDVEKIQLALYKKDNPDIINISSKPKMSNIVFNYLGVKPEEFTEKNAPQFNDNVVTRLEKEGMTWARHLSNYNKLIKIKGTYIDRFLDEHEDGIHYPSFYQHRTISGRYGSDMQQLNRPKEEGELDPIVLKYNNEIRKFFICRDGRAFIDSDYESLEPHTFSHVSSDERLKNIFRMGHDFYSTIAIATEKLHTYSADKNAPNYLGKLNKPKRQLSKAYSLGVPYGMSEYALALTLGVTKEEAKKLIDDYLNAFPDLHKWMKDSESFVKKNGYIKIESGRIRHLPKVKEIYRVHKDNILDFKYRKVLEKKIGKEEVNNLYLDYKNGLNNAKNVQIQGLSASIVNRAAIAINREFKRREIDGWVCLQIHDQLVVDVPSDKAEECRDIVQDIMENVYKLSIKLKAPAQIAKNLYEGH